MRQFQAPLLAAENLTIIFILSSFFFINVNALELDIKSNNAIMYNVKEDKIMYEKNRNDKIMIASLTKIMTALVTLDKVSNLDEKVTLTNEDFKGLIEENLVTAGFKAGQTVTYRDLLYGLLLPSGAEAAKALARTVGGSEEEFVKLMNDKAQELRLTNTHFANEIGLDDKNNYSTVTDVFEMFKYALENKTFKQIITTKSYQISDGTLTVNSTAVKNKNVGDYLLGGKTGTTDGAGLCLASLAEFDDSNFILVTAGAPYDKQGPHNFEDAKTIYDYFKDNYDYQTIFTKDDSVLKLKTKYLKKDVINFYPDKTIKKYIVNNFDKDSLTYKYKGKKIVTYDMNKGDKLGVLNIYYDGEILDNIDITLKEKPEFDILKYLKAHIEIPIGIGIFILILIIFIIRKRVKHEKLRKYA